MTEVLDLSRPTQRMMEALRASASSVEAKMAVTKALELPLRQGVLNGNNLFNIFESVYFAPGVAPEFPIDFLAPGTEGSFSAYTIPSIGKQAERHVEGDYVMVPLLDYGNVIDTHLKYIRDARWDVVRRMLEVLRAGFVRKYNTDGWNVILTAAQGRGIVTYDDAAVAGFFSKRLVALMKTVMRRNGGGNAQSVTDRAELTDLFMSPEMNEDMRSWDLSQIDDTTRREIYVAGDGGSTFSRIFGVNLHVLDEFGVGQAHQAYWTNTLGATMPTDKVEIVIGLDLLNRNAFMSPWREDIQIFEDPSYHRQRRYSLYGWAERGWASLDSRRSLAGAA